MMKFILSILLSVFLYSNGFSQNIFNKDKIISVDGFLVYHKSKIATSFEKSLNVSGNFGNHFVVNQYFVPGYKLKYEFNGGFAKALNNPNVNRYVENIQYLGVGPEIRSYVLDKHIFALYLGFEYNFLLLYTKANTFTFNGDITRNRAIGHLFSPKVGLNIFAAPNVPISISVAYDMLRGADNGQGSVYFADELNNLSVDLGVSIFFRKKAE